MTTSGWIGVDLDGTLAEYHGWKPGAPIGPPIPAMVDRVKAWLAQGAEVRIFTARVWMDSENVARREIEAWCAQHLGVVLPITNIKDFGMVQLWDDRAVRVPMNTGRPCCGNERY